MSKWTFSGIICHIANKALDYDQQAELKAKQFRTYQLSDVALYPGLAKLPHPAQKLTITELARAYEMILEEGERPEKPLKDDVACDCLFWRKYCLLCRHIWLQDHIFGQVLTNEMWDKFAFFFEDCGFEVYEKMEIKTYFKRDIYQEAGAPTKRRLEVRISIILFSQSLTK